MRERGIVGWNRRAVIGARSTTASGGPAATGPRAGARCLRISRGRRGEADLARSRSLPGYRGASVGIDSESGALVVITWWDTREQAQGAGGGLTPSEVGAGACPPPELYEVTPAAG